MALRKIIIIPIATLILLLPFLAFSALVPCGGSGQPACNVCHIFVLIKNIVDFLVYNIAMPLAVIILIYGGIMLLTSGGSEDKVRKGKSALWHAVWGLLIVFAAWLIIDTIIKWLANPSVFLFGPWNSIPSCG